MIRQSKREIAMKLKSVWPILVAVACLFGVANLAAKATAVDDGFYTAKDKEFYLTPEQLLFIRPGLEVEIHDVILPADMQMEVTYSIKDPAGLALTHDGISTPGAVDMRFTLANIPMGEEQKIAADAPLEHLRLSAMACTCTSSILY
jgi:hypothetical protein